MPHNPAKRMHSRKNESCGFFRVHITIQFHNRGFGKKIMLGLLGIKTVTITKLVWFLYAIFYPMERR